MAKLDFREASQCKCGGDPLLLTATIRLEQRDAWEDQPGKFFFYRCAGCYVNGPMSSDYGLALRQWEALQS